MELNEVSWYCAMCEQPVQVPFSGIRLPFRESPKKLALIKLLAKVEDHIGFHEWQFGHEIDNAWLEEPEMGEE